MRTDVKSVIAARALQACGRDDVKGDLDGNSAPASFTILMASPARLRWEKQVADEWTEKAALPVSPGLSNNRSCSLAE